MDLNRFIQSSQSIAAASSRVKELEKLVQEARFTLKETVRAAYVEGMTPAEISRAVGCARQTVYSLLGDVVMSKD